MKRKILWLGVSFLLVATLVLTGCPAPVVEEPVVEEPVVEVEILSIGETYQTPEVVVTVSEVIVTDSYEYYDEASDSMLSREANPGMSFLIATAYIENVGDTARQSEGVRRFHVSDSEGNAYFFGVYFGENHHLASHLWFPAGEKMEGKVLFRIPEGAGGLRLEYWGVKYPFKILAEWVIE